MLLHAGHYELPDTDPIPDASDLAELVQAQAELETEICSTETCFLDVTLEAGLSFLGLGVPPPMASWGNMLRLGFEFILREPLMLIWPSIALFIAVAGFSLVAENVRNYLDPDARRSLWGWGE